MCCHDVFSLLLTHFVLRSEPHFHFSLKSCVNQLEEKLLTWSTRFSSLVLVEGLQKPDGRTVDVKYGTYSSHSISDVKAREAESRIQPDGIEKETAGTKSLLLHTCYVSIFL